MSQQKSTTHALVDEMHRLHEGVGAAHEKLAKVTQFLGAATRHIPQDPKAVQPVEPPTSPVESEPSPK